MGASQSSLTGKLPSVEHTKGSASPSVVRQAINPLGGVGASPETAFAVGRSISPKGLVRSPADVRVPAPMSPRPMSPRPMSPRPMSPRPMSPRPMSPRPMSPRPMSPRPMSPRPMSPRPMSPRPTSSESGPMFRLPSASMYIPPTFRPPPSWFRRLATKGQSLSLGQDRPPHR